MKINANSQLPNFRLLKDFSIDLEEELSTCHLGKNNTGKTINSFCSR
ncbi:AAA family ATPase [Pedobacter jamesrossensis]